ncbi:Conserved_hypothetical protein [Hexamita inflata]|uniref:Uncharacterized protein n=1 Tax=Hexamita inflata TaxID=28002 RepID=A0AA86RIT9_9EUKA|nr:Conserved hypothetical protein [Hexamita inflata]
MDKLKCYYVSSVNSAVYPYYEPEFASRSSLQNITLPQDDIAGCVYLVKQLLTPGVSDPAHYLSLLQLLKQQLMRSQSHRGILLRFLAQFCILELYKLGNLHLFEQQALPSQMLSLTAPQRKLLLEILQTLSVDPSFLTKALNFQPLGFNGSELLQVEYKSDFIRLFKVHTPELIQLVDEGLYLYLNQNTHNYLGVNDFAVDHLFNQKHFTEILEQMLFDNAENALLAAQILLNTNSQTFLFQTNLASSLSNILKQMPENFEKVQAKICQVLQNGVRANSLAAMLNSELIKPLVKLVRNQQTVKMAASLMIDILNIDMGICFKIFELDQDVVFYLITDQQFIDVEEEPLRLAAMLLKYYQFNKKLSEKINEILLFLDQSIIPVQLQIQILNTAAANPYSQQRIREHFNAKTGDNLLKEMFQPETNDLLVEKEWMRE